MIARLEEAAKAAATLSDPRDGLKIDIVLTSGGFVVMGRLQRPGQRVRTHSHVVGYQAFADAKINPLLMGVRAVSREFE